jgi:hypothetical protein
MRRRVVLPAAVLVTFAAFLLGRATAQQPPASPDLSGAWNAAGWDMGRDPSTEPSYRGTVSMEKRDKDTYLVTWTVNGRQNRGVGLYDPRTGVFAAGYAIGQTPGVAVWQLSADHRRMDCVGTFQSRVGDVAHESWTRE